MPRPRLSWLFFALPLLASGCGRSFTEGGAPVVHIGSKAFTESVILGDLAAHLAAGSGARVEHRSRLGDTSKAWSALLVGDLDAYVEYTGTLTQEVLAKEKLRSDEDLRRSLGDRGLRMSRSLGFSDNYALGMKEQRAAELNVRSISDLRAHPDLRLGLSHAFIERADGWAGLKRHYALPFATPKGLEHSLAYRGLDGGTLDVIDLYTTDAEIKRYGVRVLADDRHYFPAYEAVLLYRADLAERAPAAVQAMLRLEGALDAGTMQELNLRATVDRVPETKVAADFLHQRLGLEVDVHIDTLPQRLLRATAQHLLLVSVSLLAAILTAIPLGIVAARRPWLGQGILALVGVVQTFPSLALLSVLIVLLRRVGPGPAIVALYVYSLLPIVRNTFTGLHDIPLNLRESAEALGLSAWARLRLIELPMASRAILAGVKTAAVINVGFATLGGLVGAGGYGQAILSGLDKNDSLLMLEGAVPAVILALAVQGLFEIAERFLVPRGLRLKPAE
jgi:osmoprotectant transport system permease protein